MEKKIGDQTEDLNIQAKGGKMKAIKIVDTIVKALHDLNKLHDKRAPWSEIVVLSIIGVLIMISPWTAIIAVILTMAARIAYLEKWLERYLNLNPF